MPVMAMNPDREGVGIDGERLKRVREACRLSQARLARDAGLSQAFISHVEHGVSDVSRLVLERIAVALRFYGGFDLQELEDFVLGNRKLLKGVPPIMYE
jgi:transcriptional regulator with XRE-family HTH domain